MEISPKLNLKILQKINSEGVNSALYIVKDRQFELRNDIKTNRQEEIKRI